MKRIFYVNFVVKALNAERLINKLKSVRVFDVKKRGKYLSFCVKEADKRQIVDILNYSLYNDFAINERTLKSLIKENVAKIVAILMFFVISLLPMFFIFDAKVFCEDSALKRRVEKVVSPYQNKLTKKGSVDEEEIQRSVLSIDKVAFAEVKIIGGKLYLYAVPEIESEKEQSEFEIKSTCGGVVTKIITLSGTPKVKVGDSVKKGDLMIDGVITSEKTGKSERVTAIGEVYGVQCIVKTVTLQKAYFDKSETGRTKTIRSVKFLDYQAQNIPPYKYYTATYSEEYLCKNFFLPVKIVSCEYKELNGEIKEANLDEEIRKLANEERESVVEIEATILSQNIEVIEMADYYQITLLTKVERKFN